MLTQLASTSYCTNDSYTLSKLSVRILDYMIQEHNLKATFSEAFVVIEISQEGSIALVGRNLSDGARC